MFATCPHCAFQAEIEAFFADDDGKRLAAAVADLPAECGRAVLAYLRLFKPPKSGLRMARAVKLAGEVAALITAGSVCKDERSGVRRPASPGMWAQGIEVMLTQRDKLSLPLETHGYLRAVVYGLADAVDAALERQKHDDARVGKHLAQPSGKPASSRRESKLENALAYITQQLHIGSITAEQAADQRAAARTKHEGAHE